MKDDEITMTQAELEAIIERASARAAAVAADEAARRALQSFFDHFDFDPDDRQSRGEFREDLRWLRRSRKMLDAVGGRMLLVIISVITGGALFWLGRAILHSLKMAIK